MGGPSDNSRVPRLAEDVDIRSLPIGPFEGFMISRMDGVLSAQEVADSTGAEVEQVVSLVEKLVGLGAAEWRAPKEAPKRPTETAGKGPSSDRPSQRPSNRPGHGARVHTRPPPPGTSRVLYDPAELEEDIDLPLERKRQILDRFYRLEELNYYELLGLPRSAEKKDIRQSYFALSKIFHPDTLYGKELGSYKFKMEQVFGALTKAYEVLGKKRKRKDYDFYLGLTDTTKAAEQGLADAEVSAEALESESFEAAAQAVVLPSKSGAAAPVAEPSREAEEPAKEKRPPPKPRTKKDRRSRAKERLKHRFRTTQSESRDPSPSVTKSREDLLRGLAGSLRSAARITGGIDKAAEQVRAGLEAEANDDLLSATNAYRLALSLNENPETRAMYERVKGQLAADLAEKYEKQAEYEEENEKWGAAALSWKKVSEGRPNSAEPLCRAAKAIVLSGGDLKHARDLAQKAVDLMPLNKKCRVTLAQVYIAAGMRKSAIGELEEAAKLDPSDEIVKNLLRDLE